MALRPDRSQWVAVRFRNNSLLGQPLRPERERYTRVGADYTNWRHGISGRLGLYGLGRVESVTGLACRSVSTLFARGQAAGTNSCQ